MARWRYFCGRLGKQGKVMKPNTNPPQVYVSLDPPEQNKDGDQGYFMVVRAHTSSGRNVLPPAYVAANMEKLTTDALEAVRVPLGWKYDTTVRWREVASWALQTMKREAEDAGHVCVQVLLD